MKSRLMVTILGLAAAVVAVNLRAGEPSKPKADDSAQLREDLALKQQILYRQFAEFEQALLRLQQRLERSTKPEERDRAAILAKALEKSRDKSITTRFEQFVDYLKTGKLTSIGDIEKAVKQSGQLAEDLRELIALLREDTLADQKRDERLNLEKMIKILGEIIRKQNTAEAQTRIAKTDPTELIKIQEKITKATADLAEKMAGKNGQGGEAKNAPGQSKAGGKGEGKKGESKNVGKDPTKKGEGKEAGKGGDGKPGEAKPGEGAKSGDPKSGEAKEGQAGSKSGKGGEGSKSGGAKESKSGQGSQSGAKENKGGEGKEAGAKEKGGVKEKTGEAKGTEKSGEEKKPGEPSASKPGGQKGGEAGSKSGKGGESKSGESKSGGAKSKQGEAKAGQAGQSSSKSGSQQAGSKSPPSSSPPSAQKNTPPKQDVAQSRKKIEDGNYKQKQAEEEIAKGKNDPASEKMQDAVKDLEAAKKKLEDLLRQLREEELERLLAALQARCEKMLAMQIQVLVGTEQVYNKIQLHKDKLANNFDKRDSLKLSDDEKEIVVEANKAIEMLEAEGSAVAFPEVFKQVREDMKHVQRRLGVVDTGAVTQAIEKDIIDTLKEMIEALKKKQQENKNPPKAGKPGQPPPNQDQKLLDQIAELKMIRSMQKRVNTRTEVYGNQYNGEQAAETRIVGELRNLSERQERIFEVTNRIAKGDNK